MKTLTALSTAVLALTFAVAANAGEGNGADGWRKLQTADNSTQVSKQINGVNHNCPMAGSQHN